MGGWADPRLTKFAVPVNGEIVGVRMGVNLSTTNEPTVFDRAAEYKKVISKVNVTTIDQPYTILHDSEARFLLAEAALRGWNTGGGTAESFYKEGVQMSFDELAAGSADGYLESVAVPADWVDPIGETVNDHAAMSPTLTPKWNTAGTPEQQLEQIITQKWIANFPEGYNTWAEWRRTGYPKIFPTANNASQGAVSSELGFRRLPYPERERLTTNPEGIADATRKLGGPDDVNTRLYWDVVGGNF
jgi:hypothetical protein